MKNPGKGCEQTLLYLLKLQQIIPTTQTRRIRRVNRKLRAAVVYAMSQTRFA